MAVRTTETAVEEIIEVDDSIDLTPFIEVASALVTTNCEEKNSAYTAEELELIERWLSAHFYAIRDPRALVEDLGRISTTIESKVHLGLNVTRYGQMAMIIDWYGGLAALNETMIKSGGKRNIAITWLGTESETLEE
jgi:hypothetical protein